MKKMRERRVLLFVATFVFTCSSRGTWRSAARALASQSVAGVAWGSAARGVLPTHGLVPWTSVRAHGLNRSEAGSYS